VRGDGESSRGDIGAESIDVDIAMGLGLTMDCGCDIGIGTVVIDEAFGDCMVPTCGGKGDVGIGDV